MVCPKTTAHVDILHHVTKFQHQPDTFRTYKNYDPRNTTLEKSVHLHSLVWFTGIFVSSLHSGCHCYLKASPTRTAWRVVAFFYFLHWARLRRTPIGMQITPQRHQFDRLHNPLKRKWGHFLSGESFLKMCSASWEFWVGQTDKGSFQVCFQRLSIPSKTELFSLSLAHNFTTV